MAIDNPTPDTIDERAQPGDVLGIERDGETTQLGDTAEDENERLRDAEEEAEKE
jgi:peptide subunit release factor RF-3